MSADSCTEIELNWDLMTPMESALWATTLALRTLDDDGGLRAADEALKRLRRLCGVRSRRPNLEDEAAEANVYLTYEEFVSWYAVAHRIRYHRDPAYKSPTSDEVEDAYGRFTLGLGSFY